MKRNITWDEAGRYGDYELECEMENFMVILDREKESELWITVKEYL